jgi:PASTA domain
MASNWTIASQSPAAGTQVKAGETVTFKVNKPGETAAAPPAAEKTTSRGLTATVAQAACDMYGGSQFRYGFKPHWIVGKLAERIENDKRFLKVEADVTNAYNAVAQVNVECTVGGTDQAPVVESFISC